MKVVLLSDIKGIGQKNDIREVKDGYARNFLFPKNLARPADASALKERKKILSGKSKELQTIKEIAREIQKTPLMFRVPTGKHGEIFAGVSKETIAERLKKLGIQVNKIDLPRALKEVGGHEVVVNFGRGVQATLQIIIEKEKKNRATSPRME